MHPGAQSVFASDGRELFEGMWNPRSLAALLTAGDPGFWRGKSVLDIGANTAGLSVELARMGASVTAAEPDPYGNTAALSREIVLELSEQEGLDLTLESADLFSVDKLPHHDVVLCLGLIYHFRYPQMILDYLSSLRPQTLFVSCQTHPSDELALFNRANPGTLPKDFLPEGTILTGWHPTRPLLERMLQWAGFKDVTSLTEERFDFPRKPDGATNSAYYRATLSEPVIPEDAKAVYYPR